MEQADHKVWQTWRPENDKPAVLVRWFITEWCNYRCSYCPQTHGRSAPKGNGLTAHAFDNFPLEQWLEAFDRHFAGHRLSLTLTGGEPTLDRANVTRFLNHISANPLTAAIRIDTNAWWKPSQFGELDRSKIVLMCTFHPSQVEEDVFLKRIELLQEAGFRIGIVNYVMTHENLALFEKRRVTFAKLGIVLHPNPLWNTAKNSWKKSLYMLKDLDIMRQYLSEKNFTYLWNTAKNFWKKSLYTPQDMEIMRRYLPEMDFIYRSQAKSPKGKPCFFPALSYEMDYKGNIWPGCIPSKTKSFFDDSLPEGPQGATPCPFSSCTCLDKYSFLTDCERNTSLSPLEDYVQIFREKENAL